MRLCLFRQNLDIETAEIAKVGDNISRTFSIDFTAFDQPISRPVEHVFVDDLLRVSDNFLDRGEPVVGLVFTRSGLDDETILGQGSERHRGAWVRWVDNIRETSLIAIHELGHVCEADHCTSENCLMFPVFRSFDGREFSLKGLFCDRTLVAIRSSWVHTRLTNAAEDRAKNHRVLPRIVDDIHPTHRPPQISTQTAMAPSPTPQIPIISSPRSSPVRPLFPDWSMTDSDPDEFIRQVKDHFGLRR